MIYSEDLYIGLVWDSGQGDVSDYEMVHYSDHHCFRMVRTIVIALAQPFEKGHFGAHFIPFEF